MKEAETYVKELDFASEKLDLRLQRFPIDETVALLVVVVVVVVDAGAPSMVVWYLPYLWRHSLTSTALSVVN